MKRALSVTVLALIFAPLSIFAQGVTTGGSVQINVFNPGTGSTVSANQNQTISWQNVPYFPGGLNDVFVENSQGYQQEIGTIPLCNCSSYSMGWIPSNQSFKPGTYRVYIRALDTAKEANVIASGYSGYFTITDQSNSTISTQLSAGERTVTYVYPDQACGTLTSQYATPGSVSVGNGPVYNLASQQCSASGQVPDTSTFRTYSCQDTTAGYQAMGKATFAFRCKAPDVSTPLWTPTPITAPTPTTTVSNAQTQATIMQLQQLLASLIQQLIALLQQQAAAQH